MDVLAQSLLATFIVSLISFVGVFVLISKFSKLKELQTALISFAAGALLGDAFLHMLAENIEEFGYESSTILFIFVGILLMLLVEAYLHCSHDTEKEAEQRKMLVLARLNILGDGVHNLLDGVAIAASFLVSPALGVTSTLAIVLHEIPQELADAAVLSYSGWRTSKILLINFLTALTAVVGALLVFIVSSFVEHADQFLVPLAAGQFIYIALADLLPEIHKKTGVAKYIIEISAFVLGILIMYALTLVE